MRMRHNVLLCKFNARLVLLLSQPLKWRCQDGEKRKRIYHINLLKRWYLPTPAMLAISSLEEEEGDIPILSEGSEVYDQLYPMEDQSVVDIEDCSVGLPVEQRRELHRVMMENLMAAQDKQHWSNMRFTQGMLFQSARNPIEFHTQLCRETG